MNHYVSKPQFDVAVLKRTKVFKMAGIDIIIQDSLVVTVNFTIIRPTY